MTRRTFLHNVWLKNGIFFNGKIFIVLKLFGVMQSNFKHERVEIKMRAING